MSWHSALHDCEVPGPEESTDIYDAMLNKTRDDLNQYRKWKIQDWGCLREYGPRAIMFYRLAPGGGNGGGNGGGGLGQV